jgi:hypothetical protein
MSCFLAEAAYVANPGHIGEQPQEGAANERKW